MADERTSLIHVVQRPATANISANASSDGKFPEIFTGGKFPESFRNLSGKFPESFRKVSGNFPYDVRASFFSRFFFNRFIYITVIL
jgi:hypothetical protein